MAKSPTDATAGAARAAEQPRTELVIRGPYSPRSQVAARIGGPSLTKQSDQERCDINNILARYQKTGLIDHVARFQPEYRAVDALTFTESQQLIANAQNMFNELPSRARSYFENDPAKFLQFMETVPEGDEGERLGELGLLQPRAAWEAAHAAENAKKAEQQAALEAAQSASEGASGGNEGTTGG